MYVCTTLKRVHFACVIQMSGWLPIFFFLALSRSLLFALPGFSQCGKLVGNIGDAELVSATDVHFNAVIAFRFT